MSTRAGRVSDFQAGIWLADLSARASHVGLSKSDPYAVGDPLTVEPQNVGYARAATTWTTVGRLLRNVASLAYTGMPTGTQIVSMTLWDAAVNGHLLANVPITPYTLTTAGGLTVAANQLFVGLDV